MGQNQMDNGLIAGSVKMHRLDEGDRWRLIKERRAFRQFTDNKDTVTTAA